MDIKTCVNSGKTCHLYGTKFCRKGVTKCFYKKYGKNGERKRCCTVHSLHRHKKLQPFIYNAHCKWFGCVRKTKLKKQCRIVKRFKNGQQTQCCQWKNVCNCGRCQQLNRKCNFVGPVLKIKSKNYCFKAPIGNKGFFVKKCCYFTHRCIGGKKRNCNKRKVCKTVGRSKKISEFSKCHWKLISKDTKRRKCCSFRKTCFNNNNNRRNCKVLKLNCKFIGNIMIIRKNKNCVWKKNWKTFKKTILLFL